MAKKRARPGRRLILFGLAVALLYGAVALGGQWKPKLGLDLQGGTRITLEASTAAGKNPTPANLEEARGIIDRRVNGSGVTESEVGTQGNNQIVVEVPGQKRGDLVDAVKSTAQLRFRLVAVVGAGQPQPAPSPSGSASPGGTATPKSTPKSRQTVTPKASSGPTPKGRALSSGLLAADQPRAKATTTPKPKPSGKASSRASGKPSGKASGSALPTAQPTQSAAAAKGAPVGQPLKWMDNPGTTWLKKFSAYTCPTATKAAAPVADNPKQPLVTCDDQGQKFLLSAAVIEGTQLKSAAPAAPDQQSVQWRVNLTFNSDARKIFADVSSKIAAQKSPLTQQQKQFAIVLDGKVISAPTVEQPILNGSAEINGSFTQTSAQSLANSLKYGALPLKFKVPVITTEGPSLASDQLSAGLWAGAFGLLLVVVYCLLYYRGLGIVVVASLGLAGIITYAVVLAMSQSLNFTLTLPGIAGLIVAVGITADSFIVYFERIRDEMRSGKSMRVAVEAGWIRARATCLAADAVSLLAAVVLYIFSIGVVKGFAFALGISTVIDLAVFFWFTHPMVSWLATFRFFHGGHRWSGLSPDHVGSRRRAIGRPSPAGGRA